MITATSSVQRRSRCYARLGRRKEPSGAYVAEKKETNQNNKDTQLEKGKSDAREQAVWGSYGRRKKMGQGGGSLEVVPLVSSPLPPVATRAARYVLTSDPALSRAAVVVVVVVAR